MSLNLIILVPSGLIMGTCKEWQFHTSQMSAVQLHHMALEYKPF